jgi:RNA polymerase sigma-70 factor (ECF subfamily)
MAEDAASDADVDVDPLLDRLREGDPQALADFFASHRERLRRMIDFRLDARLLGRVSASDVLQESYIDALKRLPHYQADPGMPFFLWLRWVTMQRLVEVHRQHIGAQMRDAGREISIDRHAGSDSLAASTARMAELMADLTSPSQAAQRNESLAFLQQALEQLEPIDREVLALRHFEELSNHEVAAVLGIQTAAASKRYVRALERLEQTLARMPGFDAGDY